MTSRKQQRVQKKDTFNNVSSVIAVTSALEKSFIKSASKQQKVVAQKALKAFNYAVKTLEKEEKSFQGRKRWGSLNATDAYLREKSHIQAEIGFNKCADKLIDINSKYGQKIQVNAEQVLMANISQNITSSPKATSVMKTKM